MFKYTPNTQKRLESVFKEVGYTVRYEKGNFNSGYCILEHKKVVVINKFFDLEARINSLAEILTFVAPDATDLSEQSVKTLQMLERQNNSN